MASAERWEVACRGRFRFPRRACRKEAAGGVSPLGAAGRRTIRVTSSPTVSDAGLQTAELMLMMPGGRGTWGRKKRHLSTAAILNMTST
jgi:hypothetical protein